MAMLALLLSMASSSLVSLAWSAAQADVDELGEGPVEEPPRELAAPVSIVLVASDGSAVSGAIDRATGSHGFSHCYVDVGHRSLDDGGGIIVDYQPGAGVHYARADAYAHRPAARVRLLGEVGCQLWGCVRAKLGQPFNAAGLLVGRATLGTCSGLVYACLPPKHQRGLLDALPNSRTCVAPNDLAKYFNATLGQTVQWKG